MLWRRELLKLFSGFCELVMETLWAVALVRLEVLSSASWNGLLCCLKCAVSQLLHTGVDAFVVVSVKFHAQHVSQVLKLEPVCLFAIPARFLLLRGGLFCQYDIH